MKKVVLFSAVLMIFAINSAIAQEFKLKVLVQANGLSRNLAFGYDPNASDSMTDVQWNEMMLPSGGAPGDFDARMTSSVTKRTYLTSEGNDGGYTDIRHKPARDSFQLQFELNNNGYNLGVPTTLYWDNTVIPAIIKHIYLSPETDPDEKIRLDMKQENQFTIPSRFDSASKYTPMLITILYNQEIMGVRSQNTASNDLTIFPNPMDSRSSLHFIISDEARLTLSAYDITGKKVFERKVNAIMGENTIELGKNDFAAHSGIYLLRLTGMENADPFGKTATIIVQ